MITGCSSLIGTRTFLLFCGAAGAAPPLCDALVALGDANCGAAAGEVITEWQFPRGAFAAAGFCSGSAGVGVAIGVLCSTAMAGFCALWPVSAWLVTSGTVTNK